MSNVKAVQPVNTPLEIAHLSDLSSKCSLELSAPNRVDPYWGGMWELGSEALWTSAKLAQRQQASGIGRLPVRYRVKEETALKNVLSPRGWRDRLDLLAVVDGWRTVSGEQASAFTGQKSLANPENTAIPSLFASSMIDVGAFTNGLFTTTQGSGFVYRPSAGKAVRDELIPNLTYPEHVSLTGGYDWSTGGQYTRHNLLSAELGLRVAEYLPIGTVLGEKMSTYDLLAGSGIGRPELKTGAAKRADLCIVRDDGLRIAVEITATMSDHFDNKVKSWAQLLAKTPMKDSGLVVLFVAAEPPGKVKEGTDSTPSSVRGRIYSAIKRAVRENPGTSYDQVAARMGVATWREYFPGNHLVSDRFMNLTADFDLGGHEEKWKTINMLDLFDLPFEPADTFDPEEILSNATMLASVPYWLRTGPRARKAARKLVDRTLRLADSIGVPVPPPARANRGSVRALGQGMGAAADTLPPARLLTA